MPHSSGGGSHGGGSHHGGGHGGSGSSPSVRKSYYAGCKHRYVYYRRNRPHYIYSDKTLEQLETPASILTIIITLIMLLPFIWAGFFVTSQIVRHPKPIKMASDHAVQIIDDIGVIEDEGSLRAVLENFRDTTGVTPAVVTMDNSEWMSHYGSLENYAYDRYLTMFSDERHWLIVYSCTVMPDGFDDWYFEGMQGNDTDPVITERMANTFTDNVDKNIRQTNFENAVTAEFNAAASYMMETHVEFEMLAFALFWDVFVAIFLITAVVSPILSAKRMRSAFEVPMAKTEDEARQQEVKCSYCGGIYVPDKSYSCPHCGASSPEHGTKIWL